jgi:hypothetical protein
VYGMTDGAIFQYFWLQENHIKDSMDTLPLQHRVT